MRIAYILQWNDGPESGVFKKVFAHARRWTQAGCDIGLFILAPKGRREAWLQEASGLHIEVQEFAGVMSRFQATRVLARSVRSWGPDVIYQRFQRYYPAIGRLAKCYPTVLEVNSDDLGERKPSIRPNYLAHIATRHLTLRAAAGIVSVSHEVVSRDRFARYGTPSLVVGNGIELDEFPITPATTNSEVRVVFIGSSGQSWHGIDKILWMASQRPGWRFDIIGTRSEELPNVPDNVHLHGVLTRKEYEPIMMNADVAIGTLALHRIGINEISPLKLREYLAYGLPVIVGYADTDFRDGAPYILQLDNIEDNIRSSMGRIEEFVESWRGRRVPRASVAHIDAPKKEYLRLEFIRGIINSEVSGR